MTYICLISKIKSETLEKEIINEVTWTTIDNNMTLMIYLILISGNSLL